jgi:hypothetical protein
VTEIRVALPVLGADRVQHKTSPPSPLQMERGVCFIPFRMQLDSKRALNSAKRASSSQLRLAPRGKLCYVRLAVSIPHSNRFGSLRSRTNTHAADRNCSFHSSIRFTLRHAVESIDFVDWFKPKYRTLYTLCHYIDAICQADDRLWISAEHHAFRGRYTSSSAEFELISNPATVG